MRIQFFCLFLIVVSMAGCSKKNMCPEPQKCLSEASDLFQKAEASNDKFEKRTSYKEACGKFYAVFESQPGLLEALQYKEAKWACFNTGDTAKIEALAVAEETAARNRVQKKK